MGFLKQFKDMKQSVEAAPEMLAQARALGEQGQQLAAAQRAAAAQQSAAAAASFTGSPGALGAADVEPIAGVSLALYADISKGLAAYAYDQSKIGLVAESMGVSAERFSAATEGWNQRMQTNPAIAREFNALYTGRGR